MGSHALRSQDPSLQEIPGNCNTTWTSIELYYGATSHLKRNASKWLVVMSERMSGEGYTFEYLTEELRKTYGRRENAWKIQKKLSQRSQQPGERLDSFVNSLTNIEFGKRVSTESYLEAFYDGLNNQDAAAHVCTMGPTTLGEALEFAVNAYGEYGAGRKVTSQPDQLVAAGLGVWRRRRGAQVRQRGESR